MLWPDQQPLRQFRVSGKGIQTGRPRQRVYEAIDEQHLAQVAGEDGTTIEGVEELQPRQPSENQLNYAKKLGINDILDNSSFYEVSNLINDAIKQELIKGGRLAGLAVPNEITYEEGRDLEELIWKTDDGEQVVWGRGNLPIAKEVENARAVGVTDITQFTSAALLYSRAWEKLDAGDDKTRLAAWYIFNVYLDFLTGDKEVTSIPNDPSFLRLAGEFLKEEKATRSLMRSSTYLRFRAQPGGWSDAHAHATRETIAYSLASKLIEVEFHIRRFSPTKKASKPPVSKTPAEESTGCSAVVAILFIVPLSAAAGLVYAITTKL